MLLTLRGVTGLVRMEQDFLDIRVDIGVMQGFKIRIAGELWAPGLFKAEFSFQLNAFFPTKLVHVLP